MTAQDDWSSRWQEGRGPHDRPMTAAQALLWVLYPVGVGLAIVAGIVLIVNGVL